MTTIEINDSTLALMTAEDQELTRAFGATSMTADEARDLLSEESYGALFGSTTQVQDAVAAIHCDNKEDTVTTVQDRETGENQELICYQGVFFAPIARMDRAFIGKEITSEDLGKISKALMVEIIAWQAAHIQAQDMKIVKKVQARAEERTRAPKKIESSWLVGEKKLAALKHIGFWAQLSEAQVQWLRNNDGANWKKIRVWRTQNGVKVHFNLFSTKSCTKLMSLAKKAQPGAKFYTDYMYTTV